MYNKKTLSEATKNLNSTKAPAKKKDNVISRTKPVVSKEGYKQGPPPAGTHYRIPGNESGTSIYNPTPYPLNLVGPNGTQAQIGPWDTNTQHFDEPYMDEFPMAEYGGDISIPDLTDYEDGGEYDLTDEEIAELKKGGYVVRELPNIPKKKNSKGYSRSLMATNRLFAQNPLTKKTKSKKRKVFDPNSKYYQEGGFQDDINKRRGVLEDWTYGQSIGMLHKAQTGEEIGYANKPAGQFEGEDYYNALTMANRNLQEVKVKPKSDQLPKGHWLKYQREFQNVTPYEDFAKERKEKYVRRTNKGLNQLAGVTKDNISKAAEQRIKQAYDRKLNTYMAKRIADDVGFDPSKRGEWIDVLMDPRYDNDPQFQKQREIFLKSDYQSKLSKPVGSRVLSGLQQTANILLPKKYELEYDIPGYTPSENLRARTDWTEPLEALSWTEYPAVYLANLAQTNPDIAGTEVGYRPGMFSGEVRPDAELAATLFDPTNYAGLHGLTKTLGKGVVKAGKIANKTYDIGKNIATIPSLGFATKQVGGQQYSYKGRPNAVYTKDKEGKWLIKTPDTKMQWQYIEDPTGNRTNLLNRQAEPLTNNAKVYQNQEMMRKVHADRYANKMKNLRNEVKVYENEQKYLPDYPVIAGESTVVNDSNLPREQQLTKQFNTSKSSAKAERIENIKAYLAQEKARQDRAAYEKTSIGQMQKNLEKQQQWENRSSGRATPADWFWTLPLAAAKAPQIVNAALELGATGSAALDLPATIAGREYANLTAGNLLRGYYGVRAAKEIPGAIGKVENAKTTREGIDASLGLLSTLVSASPLIKWNNPVYNNLSVPVGFNETIRKSISNQEVDPVAANANLLRTVSSLSGKQEGGEMWEEEIDDERRKELEALGYIVEDLD
jgi:hypothetical protein